MKINWKIRIANPTFWAHIAVAIVTPILTHFGVNWPQISTWGSLGNMVFQAVQSPVVVVAILVSVWNCIVDPTTKGVSDSASVLAGPPR